MENKQIAIKFNLLAKLSELHGESSFKYRSYSNAYMSIRKWPEELATLDESQFATIPGVGKAIQSKISELVNTGYMMALNKFLDITPSGIVELLQIKGIGPKKVNQVWRELLIESPSELLKAIDDNKLVALKGFGEKTQAALKVQLEYHLESKHKSLYATLFILAEELLQELSETFPKDLFSPIGQFARKCNVIDQIEVLTTASEKDIKALFTDSDSFTKLGDQHYYKNALLVISHCEKDAFYYEQAKLSSTKKFWSKCKIKKGKYKNETDVFESNKLPYYIPEFREDENLEKIEKYIGAQNIIDLEAIKGCIHNHSTYSDGMNTMTEMLEACIKRNFEYFVITDHSKSAFYANGLQEVRLNQQLDEIRILDQEHDDIKFFSGIESDILSDGSLDYEDEILDQLDIIVASIHSNLKMDEEKATNRLIKAIENPYTSILGHPTGRLLLNRPAYPINHKKVIEACATNNVAIELNANPNRLDIDWTWIQYAIERGVLISINPDAHSIKGLNDIFYGVASARKAALPISYCLNAMDLDEFEEWLEEQHEKRS